MSDCQLQMQTAFDCKKIPCQTAKFAYNSLTFQSKQNCLTFPDFPECGKTAMFEVAMHPDRMKPYLLLDSMVN